MHYVTNAHTHLELTALTHLCPAQPTSFLPWLARVGWKISRLSREEILSAIAQGIAELKTYGTTHVGDITHSWLSVEPLLASGLNGIVYLEVLGLERESAMERLQEAQKAIESARHHPNYGRMQVGLSLHAPYSCHPDLLRAGARWCRAENVPLCVHVAESEVETEWLLRGRLPGQARVLSPLVRATGYLPTSVPRQRPVPYLAALGVLDAHPLLVHGVYVSDEEIALIAATHCAVVHCPRSNHLLGSGRMPLERYLRANVPIYLGTDSRASSPDLNVYAEAQFACQLHHRYVPEEQIMALLHQPLEHSL